MFSSASLDTALIIASFGARSRPKEASEMNSRATEEKERDGEIEGEGGHDHGATEMNP